MVKINIRIWSTKHTGRLLFNRNTYILAHLHTNSHTHRSISKNKSEKIGQLEPDNIGAIRKVYLLESQ